ncbi:MAG: 50S ribosomal protein L15e [Candidatus Diapherotrites archaeon]|nr:50S ribosomal protein L15e [Candidatus Diapherotrites archaeon]
MLGKEDNNYDYKTFQRSKMIDWRKERGAVVPISRPTNLARARELGYKAKDGVYVFRIKIRRGSGTHTRPTRGRKPKKMGTVKITRGKSIQVLAEERVAKRYQGMEVLNSYQIGEDGVFKFFEVIMVDPFDPAIIRDKTLSWIVKDVHSGRVYRGKTSAARKSRGHRRKGVGTEKTRPGIRSRGHLGK